MPAVLYLFKLQPCNSINACSHYIQIYRTVCSRFFSSPGPCFALSVQSCESGVNLFILVRKKIMYDTLLFPTLPYSACLRYSSCQNFFPLSFFSPPSLTQLFHLASGVDPLILAWQRGKDTDGTLFVNLICKSKNVSLPPHPTPVFFPLIPL